MPSWMPVVPGVAGYKATGFRVGVLQEFLRIGAARPIAMKWGGGYHSDRWRLAVGVAFYYRCRLYLTP
jgi:hypothetical protein